MIGAQHIHIGIPTYISVRMCHSSLMDARPFEQQQFVGLNPRKKTTYGGVGEDDGPSTRACEMGISISQTAKHVGPSSRACPTAANQQPLPTSSI